MNAPTLLNDYMIYYYITGLIIILLYYSVILYNNIIVLLCHFMILYYYIAVLLYCSIILLKDAQAGNPLGRAAPLRYLEVLCGTLRPHPTNNRTSIRGMRF